VKKWKDGKEPIEKEPIEEEAELAGAPEEETLPEGEAALEPEPEVVEEPDYKTAYEEKEKQCVELLDRLQRSLAEFDNFRKRTIKEKLSIYDDGARDAYEKLLPVFDNLDRAMDVPDGKDSPLYKGIEMTLRQLGEIMKSAGLEAVPTVGQVFDPNVHHAVAHVEDESVGEGIVVAELQKGYKYKEKVLRPSMVKVAN
jgi:molecular chaperone GrpE